MSVHAAYFFAGIVVGAVIGLEVTLAFFLGRDRVAGEGFSAELIPDGSGIHLCGCLQSNVARYLIEYGPNVVSGPMCLNCARAEFVAWCLNSRPQSAKEIAAHRRSLLAEDEGELLAIEHHPDPIPPKRVQP